MVGILEYECKLSFILHKIDSLPASHRTVVPFHHPHPHHCIGLHPECAAMATGKSTTVFSYPKEFRVTTSCPLDLVQQAHIMLVIGSNKRIVG
jgi:hypothetical protein